MQERHSHARIARLGTILGVWAHPDDEAYLSAALMAMAVDNGQRVSVVTATRGEHGTPDPHHWPPPRLAALRALELAASMAVLGVTEHEFLPFEDGSLDGIPTRLGAEMVATRIETVRPDTIVTFGPDGMTGHPDHRAISAWVDRAVALTGAPTTVLHATTSRDFAEANRDIHDEYDVYFAGGPPYTPVDRLALEIRLDEAMADRKLAALRAQASQTAALEAGIGEARYRGWWSHEWFARGGRRPVAVGGRETEV